jgi:hypothetical protein
MAGGRTKKGWTVRSSRLALALTKSAEVEAGLLSRARFLRVGLSPSVNSLLAAWDAVGAANNPSAIAGCGVEENLGKSPVMMSHEGAAERVMLRTVWSFHAQLNGVSVSPLLSPPFSSVTVTPGWEQSLGPGPNRKLGVCSTLTGSMQGNIQRCSYTTSSPSINGGPCRQATKHEGAQCCVSGYHRRSAS